MKFEGVIFDLDGTLVNSLDDIADSMNAVLQQNHFPAHPNEDYKLFIGNGLRNLVRAVLPEAYKTDEELVLSNGAKVMVECPENLLKML